MSSSDLEHQLSIGELNVEITFKPIKNLHLSVNPPAGTIRVSAPQGMSIQHVRAYTIGKLGWIRSQRAKFKNQERESRRLFMERESHLVWGRRVLLHIEEDNCSPSIELHQKQLTLCVRPGTTLEKRESILAAWYRNELKKEAAVLISLWEIKLGVEVNKLFVQAMRRKWGSCNPETRNIRLNTQLAQKPRECLDYVVLHELAHLRFPTHGQQFTDLLDAMQPEWKERRKFLNDLPLQSS